MNKRINLLFIGLLSLSSTSYAKDSVILFYDNQFPIEVLQQELRDGGHINVDLEGSYNIDEKDNATKIINQTVGKIVKHNGFRRGSNQDVEETYKAGFSELINNETLWLPIYRSLERGGKSLSLMLAYNIKKVPAFVFNGKDIIYGVNSIEDAKRLFRESKKDVSTSGQQP